MDRAIPITQELPCYLQESGENFHMYISQTLSPEIWSWKCSLMAFCFELWSVFGCNHKAIHNFESGCNFLRLFSSFTESEGTDFSEIEQNTRDDLQVCKRLCCIGNYLDAMLVWCPKNFGKPITLSKHSGDMVHPLTFLFWLSGLYLSGELGKPSSKYFQRRFSVATTFLKLKLKNLHPWISL